MVDNKNKPLYDKEIKEELAEIKQTVNVADKRRKTQLYSASKERISSKAGSSQGDSDAPHLSFTAEAKNDAYVDPDANKKIHLSIADKDFRNLEVKVRDVIRRASVRVWDT